MSHVNDLHIFAFVMQIQQRPICKQVWSMGLYLSGSVMYLSNSKMFPALSFQSLEVAKASRYLLKWLPLQDEVLFFDIPWTVFSCREIHPRNHMFDVSCWSPLLHIVCVFSC